MLLLCVMLIFKMLFLCVRFLHPSDSPPSLLGCCERDSYSKLHRDFFFLLCFFSGDFLFICWTKSLNIWNGDETELLLERWSLASRAIAFVIEGSWNAVGVQIDCQNDIPRWAGMLVEGMSWMLDSQVGFRHSNVANDIPN